MTKVIASHFMHFFRYFRFLSVFMRPVDYIGSFVVHHMMMTMKFLFIAYSAIKSTALSQTQSMRTIFGVVSAQIYFTGWQAMPLISMLAIASGAIVVLQASTNLSLLGSSEMIGNLLVVIIIRELSPLMTALVVIARSGTAVASEVGNMRANREIEALESVGINPLSYIVFPRLVGGVISTICLSFYFVVMSLVGGYVITKFLLDIPWTFYYDSLVRALAFEDMWLFLLKTAFAGIFIFVISCYQGLSVKRSPTEVPIVTTQAVLSSIIYVVGFNLIVTTLFYLKHLMRLGVI